MRKWTITSHHRFHTVQRQSNFPKFFIQVDPKIMIQCISPRRPNTASKFQSLIFPRILYIFEKKKKVHTLKYYYFYSCGPTLHDSSHSNTLDGQKQLCGMKDDHQTWNIPYKSSVRMSWFQKTEGIFQIGDSPLFTKRALYGLRIFLERN